MVQSQVINSIVDYLRGYDPKSIALFGSYARGENRADSDIDILIEFKVPVGLLEFARMTRELSERIGIRVDLVSKKALKNARLKAYIEKDLRVIYSA